MASIKFCLTKSLDEVCITFIWNKITIINLILFGFLHVFTVSLTICLLIYGINLVIFRTQLKHGDVVATCRMSRRDWVGLRSV